MFGRATITLGIGPHSSSNFFFYNAILPAHHTREIRRNGCMDLELIFEAEAISAAFPCYKPTEIRILKKCWYLSLHGQPADMPTSRQQSQLAELLAAWKSHDFLMRSSCLFSQSSSEATSACSHYPVISTRTLA